MAACTVVSIASIRANGVTAGGASVAHDVTISVMSEMRETSTKFRGGDSFCDVAGIVVVLLIERGQLQLY